MIYFYIFRGKQSFPLNWSHQEFFITRAVPHQFKSFNKLVRLSEPGISSSCLVSHESRSLVSSFTSFITSQLTKLTNKDKRQEICFEITSLMFNLLFFFFTIFNFWNNLTVVSCRRHNSRNCYLKYNSLN